MAIIEEHNKPPILPPPGLSSDEFKLLLRFQNRSAVGLQQEDVPQNTSTNEIREFLDSLKCTPEPFLNTKSFLSGYENEISHQNVTLPEVGHTLFSSPVCRCLVT